MKHFKYFPKLNYENEVVTDIFKRSVVQNKVKNILANYSDVAIRDDHRPDSLSHDYYGSVDYTWLLFYANDVFDPIEDWVKSANHFNDYIMHKYNTTDPQRIQKQIGKVKNVWLVSNNGSSSTFQYEVDRYTPLKIGDIIKNPEREEYRKIISIGINRQFTVQGVFSSGFPTSSSQVKAANVYTDIHSYWKRNGVQIDYKTWSNLTEAERYTKTFYEFELEENERKRRIQLIDKDQARNLQNQLIRLLK